MADDDRPVPGRPEGIEDVEVRTFLIADIRGWTTFTQERGDEEAARLAGRLAEVTRSVVEYHRGRVLELRGDEAVVVFGSPRSALRKAAILNRPGEEERDAPSRRSANDRSRLPGSNFPKRPTSF